MDVALSIFIILIIFTVIYSVYILNKKPEVRCRCMGCQGPMRCRGCRGCQMCPGCQGPMGCLGCPRCSGRMMCPCCGGMKRV